MTDAGKTSRPWIRDPLAILVLCGATRADRLMGAGTWRVVDGEPVGVDAGPSREAHARRVRELFGTA